MSSKLVCGTCGGENFEVDGKLEWDGEEGKFIYNGGYITFFCNTCEDVEPYEEVPNEKGT